MSDALNDALKALQEEKEKMEEVNELLRQKGERMVDELINDLVQLKPERQPDRKGFHWIHIPRENEWGAVIRVNWQGYVLFSYSERDVIDADRYGDRFEPSQKDELIFDLLRGYIPPEEVAQLTKEATE